MRFKNKILKDIVRYTKEKGTFNMFKLQLRKYIVNYSTVRRIDTEIKEEELINSIGLSKPYLLPTKIGLEQGDIYYSPYILHLHRNHMEENIKLFEDFLKSKRIKQLFIQNVDEQFIRRAVKACSYGKKPDIIETRNKLKFLYYNMPPTGFFMHGFRWATSKLPKKLPKTTVKGKTWIEAESFWRAFNNLWIETYSEHLMKKYND